MRVNHSPPPSPSRLAPQDEAPSTSSASGSPSNKNAARERSVPGAGVAGSKRKHEELLTQAGSINRKKRAAEKTSVEIVLTGGTFGSKGSDTTYSLDKNAPFEERAQSYLAAVKSDPSVEHIFLKPPYFDDSKNVRPHHLLKAAQKIEITNGKVVVHGTDTLEESAFFWQLTTSPDQLLGPMVLTGAMKPSNSPLADGPENAKDAEDIARNPDPRLKGQVLVTMNRKIFSPRNVRKGDTTSVDAFEPVNGERVGTIKNGEIVIENAPSTLPRTFDLKGVKKLPTIVTIRLDPATSANRQIKTLQSQLDLQTESEAEDHKESGSYKKVIIVEGYGNGSLPDDNDSYREVKSYLAELAKGGALVIRSTKVTDGVVTPQDEDKANKFICVGALTTNKARILAMVALAAARKEGTEMNYEQLAETFDQFQPKN